MVNAQTQAFTAKPRAVEHGKYRDEEDDVYYANIHFDKRVHRGSNYSRPEVAAAGASPPERRTRPKVLLIHVFVAVHLDERNDIKPL